MKSSLIKSSKSSGFTSYSNDHIICNCLQDHTFRFKMVLEKHMGLGGTAVVKVETLAKEMGKSTKSASRALHWFLDNSNLKVKKKGLLYEFYTLPDTSVLYGKTRVSHISVHGCPHIKRLIEKDTYKKTVGSFNKIDLNAEEFQLVDSITDWVTLPIFKPRLSKKQNRLRIISELKNVGYEVLNNTYRAVAVRGGDPHPKVFWETLDSFKKQNV